MEGERGAGRQCRPGPQRSSNGGTARGTCLVFTAPVLYKRGLGELGGVREILHTDMWRGGGSGVVEGYSHYAVMASTWGVFLLRGQGKRKRGSGGVLCLMAREREEEGEGDFSS